MGIPKFNKWLSRKVRTSNIKGVYFDKLPKRVSSLSFDLNGIIHRARQIVYGMTEETIPGYKETLKKMKPAEIQKKVFNTVCLILADVTLKVAPAESVVITIDGITNLAKIKQQRGRRYNSASSEYADQPDSCEVTPGTLFMLKLDLYLRKWLQDNRQFFPPTLIYSSHLDPGEGEHKIMSFYRRGVIKGNGFHMVYGLDGDLILLSMMSSLENIVLIREDMSKLISINGLKKMLIDLAPFKLKESVIPDFVAMMSLIGNDFVPHGHLHDSMYERIEGMLREYFRQNLPITEKTQSVRIINFNNLVCIANQLGNIDVKQTSIEAIHQFTEPEKHYPNRFYQASIIEEDISGKVGIKRKIFDYSRFRSAWYNNELYVSGGIPGIRESIPANQAGVEDMAKKYIEGIAWVFRYYQTIHVESYWYYPYNHCPLMKDLAIVLKSASPGIGRDLNDKFKKEYKLLHGPLEQLLAVIPYSNRENNVPKVLHSVMESTSDYSYMFPRGFRCELDGLGVDETYLATPIVNMVDMNEIINITKNFKPKLWETRPSEVIRPTEDSTKSYVVLSTEMRAQLDQETYRNLKRRETENLQRRTMNNKQEPVRDLRNPPRSGNKMQTRETYDITVADIQKVGDFVLVQDNTLKYGTKMRLLPYFKNLKDRGITEVVGVGSTHGYGQAAAAWCCKEAGLKCTLFVNKERKRTYMTSEAIKLGAVVKEIGDISSGKRARMNELTEMAENYEKGNPKVAHLPIGFFSPESLQVLSENMKNVKNSYNLNPRRIWVVGGTGFVAASLGKAFPNAEILIVEVGFPVWKDVLQGVKYKVYKYPHGAYKDAAIELPPYAALANYDAKVWYFAKRFGQPGDLIWNVK